LGWCDRAGAEVLLTQMWSCVEWNRFAGVNALQSGPRSLAAFADGLAGLVDHLVHERGHRSIRWLAIVNEPNIGGGWWLGPDRQPMALGPALAAVRAALERRGLDVALTAPEWNRLRDPDGEQFDWRTDRNIGALSAHNYSGARAVAQIEKWVERARRRGLPFFLSEIGDFRIGWKGSSPGPASFAAALSNAAQILRGVEVGVDGFNRWSFTNRGDLDGQWQLVRTWDSQARAYRRRIEPEPVPYYAFGLLTRYWANRSTALATLHRGGEELSIAALESPGGELTLLVANQAEHAVGLEIALEGVARAAELQRYRVTEAAVAETGFRLEPETWLVLGVGRNDGRDLLPPRSLTAYSTWRRTHDEPGVVAG
jgi:hypothetical protein